MVFVPAVHIIELEAQNRFYQQILTGNSGGKDQYGDMWHVIIDLLTLSIDYKYMN